MHSFRKALHSSRFSVSLGDGAAAFETEGFRAAQVGVGTPEMLRLQKHV
jgi:hypothetical protein